MANNGQNLWMVDNYVPATACISTPQLGPRPFDSSPPALAGGARSGFRPTGVVEGAKGLPVGLHRYGDHLLGAPSSKPPSES